MENGREISKEREEREKTKRERERERGREGGERERERIACLRTLEVCEILHGKERHRCGDYGRVTRLLKCTFFSRETVS